MRSTIILTGLLLLLGGCSADWPLGRDDRPPIVLISVDTLRSDRLPAYGYGGIETPAFERLRSAGILFERAYSPTPTTLPAHASMLTGLPPTQHGVRGNVGYRLSSGELSYLPQILKASGYATGATVSSFVMRRETGLAEGFDVYDDALEYRANIGAEGMQREGQKSLEAILPWLQSVSGRPFFLLFHIYEPHSPFKPPEPYKSRYPSAYDGEVAHADEIVGKLLDELVDLDVYDDALIILTSDHGEGLGDHGETGHGIFLYRESLQIPLILRLPHGESAGSRVEEPVQLADIVPTILEWVGIEKPAELAGRSLISFLENPGPERILYAETYFPRFYFGWSELSSAIQGRYQYIESPEPELYDLVKDPAQGTNLIGTEPGQVAPLRQYLSQLDRNLEYPKSTDRETWEKLAALGYVGHAQVRAAGDLPAPQSQVDLIESLQVGFRQALAGEHLDAIATLTQLVEENPNALAAWEQIGRSNEKLRRYEPAFVAYSRALELSANEPHLLLAAARVASRAGRLEEAGELARAAIVWDPAAGHLSLAQTLLMQGDLDAVEQNASRSLELRRPNFPALFLLAQVKLATGQAQEALELCDQAVEEEEGRPQPRVELLRGNSFATLERWEEAESAWRREIELFPGGFQAYTRLAAFLLRHERAEEAVQVVRSLVKANPTPAGYRAAARTLQLIGDAQGAEALLAHARQRFPDSSELQTVQ